VGQRQKQGSPKKSSRLDINKTLANEIKSVVKMTVLYGSIIENGSVRKHGGNCSMLSTRWNGKTVIVD
jgi:hypothetical protein